MKRFATELEFICRIKGDGSGTEPVAAGYLDNKFNREELLKLRSLSISNKTYIASGMSSFVVKLKNPFYEK